MNDLRRKSRTILTLEKLEYNVPLERRRLHAAGAAESAVRALTLLLLSCRAQRTRRSSRIAGSAQVQSAVYPQTTPQDDERVAVEALFRDSSPRYRPPTG